ncbi:MAG: hypothetical protein HY321_12355 [Armatimonadetes bacterium]|nr:hypothetical protein [Armatimonadota bacterium]
MEPDGTQKLTAKQRKAILALLSEPGIDKAAALADVAPNTLWRWRREPAFREALAEARRETFASATTALAAAAAKAVVVLVEIATNPGAREAARVSAARAILERASNAIETEDLLARIAAVEERLGA